VATPGYRLRPYAGPADDRALLAVNAAAFVDLPDQGGWTGADLAARTGAPWFRADDLLLLVDPRAEAGARVPDGRLAGFHWTKVHPDGAGEVYVVGLDPVYQGRGLGAPLTAAGLAHLAGRGCRQVGLFVDDTNAAALALYRRLGFTTARQDVLYRLSER
jgi:mycothiol synthase